MLNVRSQWATAKDAGPHDADRVRCQAVALTVWRRRPAFLALLNSGRATLEV